MEDLNVLGVFTRGREGGRAKEEGRGGSFFPESCQKRLRGTPIHQPEQ